MKQPRIIEISWFKKPKESNLRLRTINNTEISVMIGKPIKVIPMEDIKQMIEELMRRIEAAGYWSHAGGQDKKYGHQSLMIRGSKWDKLKTESKELLNKLDKVKHATKKDS